MRTFSHFLALTYTYIKKEKTELKKISSFLCFLAGLCSLLRTALAMSLADNSDSSQAARARPSHLIDQHLSALGENLNTFE